MKTFFCLLILSFPIIAQTDKPLEYAAWSEKKECAYSTVQLKPGQTLSCDSYVFEGQTIRTIDHAGLTVAVAFAERDGYFVGDVYVRNDTPERVLVDPENWGVIYAKTTADVAAGRSELEYAIDPDKIARKILGRTRWAIFFSALGSGAATTTTTSSVRIVDPQGGVSTGTVQTTAPDRSAQLRTAQQSQVLVSDANARVANVLSTALRANTLFPSAYVNGLVYFKSNKKAGIRNVIMNVGGRNYTFLY